MDIMDIKPLPPPLPALSTEIWQIIFRHAFEMAIEPKDQFEKPHEYLWYSRRDADRKSTVVSVMQTCKVSQQFMVENIIDASSAGTAWQAQ